MLPVKHCLWAQVVPIEPKQIERIEIWALRAFHIGERPESVVLHLEEPVAVIERLSAELQRNGRAAIAT
jgi:hypothetical protein